MKRERTATAPRTQRSRRYCQLASNVEPNSSPLLRWNIPTSTNTFGQSSYPRKRGRPEVPTMKLPLTDHASVRANQRGTKNEHIALLEEFADFQLNAGGGCSREFLSKRMAIELAREGHSPQLTDAASRILLLRSPLDRIVTLLKPRRGSRIRRASFRYRRRRGARAQE